MLKKVGDVPQHVSRVEGRLSEVLVLAKEGEPVRVGDGVNGAIGHGVRAPTRVPLASGGKRAPHDGVPRAAPKKRRRHKKAPKVAQVRGRVSIAIQRPRQGHEPATRVPKEPTNHTARQAPMRGRQVRANDV